MAINAILDTFHITILIHTVLSMIIVILIEKLATERFHRLYNYVILVLFAVPGELYVEHNQLGWTDVCVHHHTHADWTGVRTSFTSDKNMIVHANHLHGNECGPV